MNPTDIPRLGLVAGTGDFPVLIARTARGLGIPVVGFSLSEHANESLRPYCDSYHMIRLSRISEFIEIAREEGARHLILAGRIPHEILMNPMLLFDGRIRRILGTLANKKADTVLGAFTTELEAEGFTILNSTMFLTGAMPEPGLLTPRRAPTREVSADIEFGYRTAKSIAGLDIGQTVAVKNGIVVAVEALEGTDRLILRAGELAGEGVTIVKVSKPRQNMKFDVPIMGLQTVRHLVQIRAAAMAISARQSLFFDRDEAVALAERHGLALVAHADEQQPGPPPPLP
jgi:DUF1009 family protein